MRQDKTSSLRAQWLGERLKKARLAAGYKLRDAAQYLQLHEATMSRFESATYAVRRSYVKDLIDFYRVSDKRERDALLQLCDDAWRKDWWDGQAADVEKEFIDYTWLEARASRICKFEPMLIDGLLQTREYAAATIRRLGEPDSTDAQIDGLVAFRMLRQDILQGKRPTRLISVMEDVALRRMVGSVETMRGALAKLLEAAAETHIDVRILPASAGLHMGLSGPFTYFEMPHPYSDVAFVDNLAGHTYLEEAAKVERFQRAYDDICRAALDAKSSTQLIHRILKDLQ